MRKYFIPFALLFALLPASLFAKTEVYVVAVGVNHYENNKICSTLTYSKQDAIEFAKVMSNFTTHITSIFNEQATRSKVRAALGRVCAQADSDDVVIFYYSGHGGDNCFCCYDFGRDVPGLTYKDIQDLFKTCKAKSKMVFADSCQSGALSKKKSNAGSSPSSTDKKNPVMFFLSSRSDEYSSENVGLENGLFTYYLIKGLNKAADANRDNVITAKELYKYVRNNVVKVSKKKQHPIMWGKFNDNMIVVDWRK